MVTAVCHRSSESSFASPERGEPRPADAVAPAHTQPLERLDLAQVCEALIAHTVAHQRDVFQAAHSRQVRHPVVGNALRIFDRNHPQPLERLQLLEPGVGDLEAAQLERLQVRQVFEVNQPLVGNVAAAAQVEQCDLRHAFELCQPVVRKISEQQVELFQLRHRPQGLEPLVSDARTAQVDRFQIGEAFQVLEPRVRDGRAVVELEFDQFFQARDMGQGRVIDPRAPDHQRFQLRKFRDRLQLFRADALIPQVDAGDRAVFVESELPAQFFKSHPGGFLVGRQRTEGDLLRVVLRSQAFPRAKSRCEKKPRNSD
ncbi:MAG: hypothetical protein HY290_15525 [Planctomycetia bacterium]|nr:hypothetical protein [Planctomycetia bacterium]